MMVSLHRALPPHPAVLDCATVEVTVTLDTAVIACFNYGEDMTDADLAAARRVRGKQPRLFLRCDALLTRTNEKLLRQHLRRHYEATHAET